MIFYLEAEPKNNPDYIPNIDCKESYNAYRTVRNKNKKQQTKLKKQINKVYIDMLPNPNSPERSPGIECDNIVSCESDENVSENVSEEWLPKLPFKKNKKKHKKQKKQKKRKQKTKTKPKTKPKTKTKKKPKCKKIPKKIPKIPKTKTKTKKKPNTNPKPQRNFNTLTSPHAMRWKETQYHVPVSYSQTPLPIILPLVIPPFSLPMLSLPKPTPILPSIHSQPKSKPLPKPTPISLLPKSKPMPISPLPKPKPMPISSLPKPKPMSMPQFKIRQCHQPKPMLMPQLTISNKKCKCGNFLLYGTIKEVLNVAHNKQLGHSQIWCDSCNRRCLSKTYQCPNFDFHEQNFCYPTCLSMQKDNNQSMDIDIDDDIDIDMIQIQSNEPCDAEQYDGDEDQCNNDEDAEQYTFDDDDDQDEDEDDQCNINDTKKLKFADIYSRIVFEYETDDLDQDIITSAWLQNNGIIYGDSQPEKLTVNSFKNRYDDLVELMRRKLPNVFPKHVHRGDMLELVFACGVAIFDKQDDEYSGQLSNRKLINHGFDLQAFEIEKLLGVVSHLGRRYQSLNTDNKTDRITEIKGTATGCGVLFHFDTLLSDLIIAHFWNKVIYCKPVMDYNKNQENELICMDCGVLILPLRSTADKLYKFELRQEQSEGTSFISIF